MTLYITNTETGEMKELFAPLRRKPTYKVQRMQAPRTRQTTHREPRRVQRQVAPLNDLLGALSGFLVALAFLVATSVRP